MTLTNHRAGKQANVNMDTATLEKVDNYCLTLDISRSQFMRKAAAEYLQNHPLTDENEK